MTNSHTALMELDDLSVEIEGARVVDRLSLRLDRGIIHGLAGESGSGKSMTALAMMGLLPDGAHTNGSVRMDLRGASLDLLALDDASMCDIRGNRIAMIFQEPMTALNPLQSIGNQVAETVRVHSPTGQREALAIAADRLDRVGIASDRTGLEKFPHELSGGQRQRVMIAQAIALRPSLLIADEPTTALDVTTQAGILNLLHELVDEENMAMLMITHDLAVLAHHARSISVMKDGRIVEEAAQENLFRRPRHDYVRQLIRAAGHRQAGPNPGPSPDPNLRSKADTTSSERLLEVDGVSLSYRSRRRGFLGQGALEPAVKNVSLTVNAGESVALVGESGSGKSTLARAILGLEPLQNGTISFGGDALSSAGLDAHNMRAAMQIVFQDPFGSFNPRHRVRRLVAEPFFGLAEQPSAEDRIEAVENALLSVGLNPEDGERFIHEFSGGQRQRIAIARALVTHPRLIILDEAVSALDVSIRAQILDLLVGLRQNHDLAYLFITHDLGVVRAIADRVMVMKGGQIIESGPTTAVLDNPQASYTRDLVAASPQLPSEWLASSEPS